MKTIKVRISATINNEYENRCPDYMPLHKLHEGLCELTIEEAGVVLADAEYHCNRDAFDIGPYDMPLHIYNAYRALAKQILKLAKPEVAL